MCQMVGLASACPGVLQLPLARMEGGEVALIYGWPSCQKVVEEGAADVFSDCQTFFAATVMRLSHAQLAVWKSYAQNSELLVERIGVLLPDCRSHACARPRRTWCSWRRTCTRPT